MGDYQFTRQIDLTRYPEIDSAAVRVLWSDDWYDGTLSGMAVVNGETLYYDFYHEDDNTDVRTFVLYRLTPEQEAYERGWRALEEEAGGVLVFTDEGTVELIPERAPGAREAFAERRRREHRRLDLSIAEVVGWFRDRGNRAFAGVQTHQGSG